ncbi:MAG: membrane dipeptidase, partial [Rhizobiaceae bacterium]|nr:membrane dipeptidase [Rhizobiaceae bacterium]
SADLIVRAHTVEDIRQAKRDGKTAIILGFENVSAFEDKIGYIELPDWISDISIATVFSVIPVPTVVFAVVAAALALLMRRTRFGLETQ